MIAKSTFKGTDYSLPVIGTPNSVSSFTRQSLIDFYNKWYVSKNMTLIVTGGGNQRWTMLTQNSSLILSSAGKNLPLIIESMQKQAVTTDTMQMQLASINSNHQQPSTLAKVSNAISTWFYSLIS